jgi:hypothetical protein
MSKALIQLMEEHLTRVWSERNPVSRLKALDTLYAKDSILYEVGEIISGHEAINNKVSGIVGSIPPDFIFTMMKPIIINNNAGRLLWGLGPKGKTPVSTGTDIAIFENGKIKLLYVFIDE